MKTDRVGDAIRRGVAFITREQQQDGGFISLSSPTRTPFKPKITYKTTFTPALILAALSNIESADAMNIRKRLATWLLAQKTPNWSFNYWAVSAPERKTLPYPDDLDDTFCALTALRLHDPSTIDEACLGKVVKLLIATESQVGGPYRTWLAPKNASKVWQDIDLAVNSNIAYFLEMVAEPLPNLTAFMDQAIASDTLHSPYYPTGYPLAYYLARAYNGQQQNKLISYLARRQKHGWWGSPLRTALAVASLTRMGQTEHYKTAIRRLLDTQNQDGSWRAEAFCLDPAIQNKQYYSGSDALTTAFAIEALALWDTRQRQTPATTTTARNEPFDKTGGELLNAITSTIQKDLNSLGRPLKNHGLAVLGRVQKEDKRHEIPLLPYYFNTSLKRPANLKDTKPFVHLGLANLYGWIAYTVYDDFLDNEGDPKLLSIANASLRYSVKYFGQALDDAAFQRLVEQTFNNIDSANAWEVSHCRAKVAGKTVTIGDLPAHPKTIRLADRSLGHTLTPLGVLVAVGIGPDDPRAVAVRRALRHYLVARQLNDDLHDWEQDLQAGIINYVVATNLRELSVRPGKHNLGRLVPKMQRQFWHQTLISICSTISHHCELARRAARASHLLTQHNTITSLVNKIDESVAESLREQAKAERFLKAYRK